jgi:hypothetical protein
MKRNAIPCLLLAPALLCAQTSAPLVATHAAWPARENLVTFEVLNRSAKPIHAWTMTVTARKKKGALAFSLTSEDCRTLTLPVEPERTARCEASVEGNTADPAITTDVAITSVLFEDGSAAGDARLLAAEGEKRAQRLALASYWLERM